MAAGDRSVRQSPATAFLCDGICELSAMTNKFEDQRGDVRLYVIGDIHGRSDLLDRIVDEISRDIESHPSKECLTITLGDYVDRGPDSRGVLDRLSNNPFPTRYVALRGNHESLFETFLQNPSTGDLWRGLGGLATLRSYGVLVNEPIVGKGFEQASSALRAAIPNEHLRFLSDLKPSLTIGNIFLCHAGIRPGIPFENQSVEDLMWIRDEFLNSTTDFGKVVVHGHSPTEWPDIRPNRINIDTGAFASGRLTCLVIDGEPGRFLFTA
jgi:serine/threonine protein phosphatase 1